MKAHGQFESEFYRVFTQKVHALQFISGSIRFCHIYYYRKIEDLSRRDKKEGESHLEVNGIATHSMFARTAPYVCCFHRTLEAARECDFGPFIVKVQSPKSLAEGITNSLANRNEKFFGGVEGVIVEYTKGDAVTYPVGSVEMARLNYAQKPPFPFKREDEFRMVILSKKCLGDAITIDIGKPVDDCHLL